MEVLEFHGEISILDSKETLGYRGGTFDFCGGGSSSNLVAIIGSFR